jgi:hypothetical protein
MTTTEAVPTTDPFAEIAAVERRLEAARKERGDLGYKQREWASKMHAAAAELDALAATDPDQFDADGQPRKGTRAAKLKATLADAPTSRWQAMIDGSDQRIAELERERHEVRRAHHLALARRQWDDGLEACGEIKEWVREGLALVARAQGGYHVLVEILGEALGSAIDGRSIQTDPRLDTLEQVLSGSFEGLHPPRVPALVPFEGEEPGAYMTQDGGWVPAASADRAKAGLAATQPERVVRPI